MLTLLTALSRHPLSRLPAGEREESEGGQEEPTRPGRASQGSPSLLERLGLRPLVQG